MFESDIFALMVLPALIFLARIADVSIGTIRIIFISKGTKFLSAFLGFFEVLIWILAIGQIMQNLNNWVTYLAYAAGFSAGTLIGMYIEEKLAVGTILVQAITKNEASKLIRELRKKHFRLATIAAQGNDGKVHILYIMTKRRNFPKVIKLIKKYNPRAFLAVEDIRIVQENMAFLKGGIPHSKRK